MFLAPNFCGGALPEFLDLHYKIQPVSDHVAKFHGDRPRELGAAVASLKKHHEHFIRPPVVPLLSVHGRPNEIETGNNGKRYKFKTARQQMLTFSLSLSLKRHFRFPKGNIPCTDNYVFVDTYRPTLELVFPLKRISTHKTDLVTVLGTDA